MLMIRSPTRAIATTSVRRITGGSSTAVSASGVPSDVLDRRRSLGRTRIEAYSPDRAALVAAVPSGPKSSITRDDVPRFRRADVKGGKLDSVVFAMRRAGTAGA